MLKNIWNFLWNRKILLVILIVILVGGGYYFSKKSQSKAPQYQTATVTKGTLITSVTASGQITSANNVSITIQASGVVKDVLVKNGDTVTQGQVIADLTLDQASQQKQEAALASYLSAKSSLESAQANINSLQSAEFTANQKFINDAVARDLLTDDPTYIEENSSWLQAQANYVNQQDVISQAQASLASASLSLSQSSSTITAPVAGVIKGLTISPGAIITLSSSSSSSTSTSQVLGSVYQAGPIQAQVNIAEIDSVNVSEGQKVTMTLDAFPNKTFTGKVVSIDTNGVVSSGVTTYPAVITFDTSNDHIYPNMAVTADIITNVENDVLLVPSEAIQSSTTGGSTVRVLQNGQPVSVPVQVGGSNDTQTEVTSGLNEGDTVITSVAVSAATTTTTGSASPFGAIGGRGVGGGGFGGGAAATRGRGG